MVRSIWLPVLLIVTPLQSALAQVASGPAAGDSVAPLKVFAVVGEIKDKEVDYAAERKDKPTIYVFIQADKFDRPMNRFLKILDAAVSERFAGTYIVAVWLTDDKEKTKDYLPRVQMSVQYQATALTYFPGASSGPADWHVNPDAHITVVVANNAKVTAAFGYQSVNETDAPAVEDVLKKAVGK
jgi:menaquinone-dependent protoporphyrinogen IX oxidase